MTFSVKAIVVCIFLYLTCRKDRLCIRIDNCSTPDGTFILNGELRCHSIEGDCLGHLVQSSPSLSAAP